MVKKACEHVSVEAGHVAEQTTQRCSTAGRAAPTSPTAAPLLKVVAVSERQADTPRVSRDGAFPD